MLPINRTRAGLRVVDASLTSTQCPSRMALTSECLLFACGTCLQHMDTLRSGLIRSCIDFYLECPGSPASLMHLQPGAYLQAPTLV